MDRIVFKNGIVEDYTIVLASRDLRKLGQITGVENVRFKNNLNSASELSFTVSKHDMLCFNSNVDHDIARYKKIKQAIWNQIVDLKLVWIKELNKYFEIKVTLEDSSKGVQKSITATHLCEAELSQLLLEGVEINSEADILRDSYKITTFYNPTDSEASMLNRILKDKAPHYHIKHVDASLMNLQRTFSISGTNIYDFLVGECAEQFNCLFVFDSADRSISAYDLYAVCKDCGNRFEEYDKCPKCGSNNIKYFGQDTTILVDKENLTDSIQMNVDTNSLKNSFKLVAGDDLMTAAVRMMNPNGTDYIYYFSDRQREDMPKELVQKIDEYNELYNSTIDEYTKLIKGTFNDSGKVVEKGIFQLTDDILYLTSGMMPKLENAEVTAKTEIAHLTKENLSPVALTKVTPSTSATTVASALKNYAKVYVKSGYVKVDVADGEFTYIGVKEPADGTSGDGTANTIHYGTWTGTITVTNYSDKEDTEQVTLTDIEVYDDYYSFIKQKILKELAKSDDESSVFDVLGIDELDKFKEALKLYCLNRLTSFYDAIQGALDVLVQLGYGEKDAAPYYEVLYLPYYNKLQACQEEIDKRKAEIDEVQATLDKKEAAREDIQKKLNFKDYLGDYYTVFCSYRREDIYSNENYISEGLSNSELIEWAEEFIETAKKELYKSGEKQVTISSTLYNLLLMKEFKPLIDYFELGNWIRVRIDGELYRIRLVSYTIDFSSLQTIAVEFAVMSKIKDLAYEAQQIQKTISSISSSYSYVAQQAEQGDKASNRILQWMNEGLSSNLVQITNNENREVIYDGHGLLGRSYDDITGTYSPKQVRITNNTLAFTDDGWQSVRQAVGEHNYRRYNDSTNEWEMVSGYGMTADFVTAGHVSGATMVGGQIYSENYSNGAKKEGTYIDLKEGSFSFAGGGLTYSKDDGLKLSTAAIEDTVKDVDTLAENLHIKAENIDGDIQSDQISSLDSSKISGIITAKQVEEGTIKAGSVNASGINGQIQSDQIASLDASKISGSISSDQISSLAASKITGTVASSKIAATLSNKTLSGSFSGTVNASSVQVANDGNTYNGLTTNITVGDNILHFVNGILVQVE